MVNLLAIFGKNVPLLINTQTAEILLLGVFWLPTLFPPIQVLQQSKCVDGDGSFLTFIFQGR